MWVVGKGDSRKHGLFKEGIDKRRAAVHLQLDGLGEPGRSQARELGELGHDYDDGIGF